MIGAMNIKSLALAPTLVLALAFPALAERIPLNELSRYLNSLTTATSEFTQVNPDGSISTGTVFIQRPGRVRFEYNNDNTLVMASGGNVAVFDPKSGGPQQYPLSQTPLSIILDRNVNLARANMVTAHTESKNATVVTAQDPQNPQYGNIQMVFTGGPTQLRQWVVTDDSGQKTTVILGEMRQVASIPASKFSIQNELSRRN